MNIQSPALGQAWELLRTVKDPEIPVLDIVELGIVRDVKISGSVIEVIITPTYSGCPAMQAIQDDITTAFTSYTLYPLKLTTTLFPAWTTDWMTEEAKVKLTAEGIAPPQHGSADKGLLMGRLRDVKCPRCGSHSTQMISQFGSTACKSLYRCNDCLEPFDYFKCI